jgi:hypothetical protein
VRRLTDRPTYRCDEQETRVIRIRAALAALAALGTAAVLGTSPAASATPTAHAAHTRTTAAAPAACTGAFHGDPRLGPEPLPRVYQFPVGPLVAHYHRTGRLSPAAFLARYWQGPADTGGWKYPPNDGFAEVNGKLDKHDRTVPRGALLDRFGSEYGAFLAPAGASYASRALPPQSLDTRDPADPCNYHVYRVTRAFHAYEGSIAPWFAQRGGGEQVELDPALLDPGAGQSLNVQWLLNHGYLAAVGTD